MSLEKPNIRSDDRENGEDSTIKKEGLDKLRPPELAGKEIIYLEKGIDNWFSQVNSYWCNCGYWRRSVLEEEGRKKLYHDRNHRNGVSEIVDRMSSPGHSETKTLSGISFQLDRLLGKYEEAEYVDQEVLLELKSIFNEILRLQKGYWWKECSFIPSFESDNESQPENILPNFQKQEGELSEVHPLLSDFLRLGLDPEREDLPPYIKQELNFAGQSAVLQNTLFDTERLSRDFFTKLKKHSPESKQPKYIMFLIDIRAKDIILHGRDTSPEEIEAILAFQKLGQSIKDKSYDDPMVLEVERQKDLLFSEWIELCKNQRKMGL